MADTENQPLSNGISNGNGDIDGKPAKSHKPHKEHKHKKVKKEKKEKKEKKNKEHKHKHKNKEEDGEKEKKRSLKHKHDSQGGVGKVKAEPHSDDEAPLRKRRKSKTSDDDEDYKPLKSSAKKVKTEPKPAPVASKRKASSSTQPKMSKIKGKKRPTTYSKRVSGYTKRIKRSVQCHCPSCDRTSRSIRARRTKKSTIKTASRRRKCPKRGAGASRKVKTEFDTPEKKKTKRELAQEKEKDVWKWWEEERKEDGVKWRTLEHKGPQFAPEYEPLPSNVQLKYNGKTVKLSRAAEEVAGFYGKMLNHDYCSNDMFNKNFFRDWRKVMTNKEREMITDLKKCDFNAILEYYTQQSELRKARPKEEKLREKEKNEALIEEYGYCMIDGHREKIGNFRVEPPSLFRGRGDHPKMGTLKRRIMPEDVVINCGKEGTPPKPPPGHKWKEVRHDNQVTWLASWTENVQNAIKYVMLNPASRLKGEKDWAKYEKARQLHNIIDKVRANYQDDFKSKEMMIRQRGTAVYFIDKLALRAGNEKDSDEQADTVGCCSLRYEHIKLHDTKDGMEWVVDFDFLGKDSIRYQNSVAVEKRVYKNLQRFMENKKSGDELFDRITTSLLNQHLQTIMDGLTAKVFRTYNASITLERQLNLLTKETDNVAAKMLSYNRANRAVAVLCNHQRAVPKNFSQQMERIQEKIDAKRNDVAQAAAELKDAKSNARSSRGAAASAQVETKKKKYDKALEMLHRLEVQATDKDENKDIALGTSKLNYLDPRISVAWCKKHDVAIEKVYNKTQRQKFMWAIDMAGPEFTFVE